MGFVIEQHSDEFTCRKSTQEIKTSVLHIFPSFVCFHGKKTEEQIMLYEESESLITVFPISWTKSETIESVFFNK